MRPGRPLRRLLPFAAVACVATLAAAACSVGQAAVPGPGERALAAASGAPSPAPATVPSLDPPIDPDIGINNITHVIVIVQENRSFDHYFGTFPGADGYPRDAQGRIDVCVPDPAAHTCRRPYHDTNLFDAGGPHGLTGSAISEDGGRMDGFVQALEQIGNGCEHRPDDFACRRARRGRPGSPTSWGITPARRSRITGRTRGISSYRITCSRRSPRGPCPRTCTWCRAGPPRAPTSATR